LHESGGHVLLMPPSLRDWVPAHHPVHSIDQVVNDLDLSAIYADYSEAKGQPPYNPRMMVKVWVCAYSLGIRSSRRNERCMMISDFASYRGTNSRTSGLWPPFDAGTTKR